jgi:Transcription factor zinc-finger
MSILGEKCVRCGARTRNVYQGKPTCDPCREYLELALAQAREVKRACPADNATLAKEIVHGVIIDRCPTCRGVWLDAGEMERMNQDVADEVWTATAFGRPLG